MGWAARANNAAEVSKAFGHKKPAKAPGGSLGRSLVLANPRQMRQAAISALLRTIGPGQTRQPDTPALPADAAARLAGGGSDGG